MSSLPPQITFAQLSKCTFDGHYTLLKPIGQGGYGTVYRAIENPSGDTVAIKVVRTPEPGTYHAELLDLEVEAITKMHVLRSLVPLRHIFEEDDFTFIVLDYIDGGDLEGPIMKDRLFVGDNERVRYIFNRMLIAVEDVHAYGYRHRDVKPGNFLVTKGLERVFITDFGLCSKGDGPVKDSFGDTGRGTYTHLAPEGFAPENEPVRIDGAKSDVYALATTLFQMLYGEYPWIQSTLEDPRYEFFLESREEFFNWRDAYAVDLGEPGLSPDARSLLIDALNPDMDERLDLYEFDRRFSLIDDFFGSRDRSERTSEPPSLESMSLFVISGESDESEEAPVTPQHGLAPLEDDIADSKVADDEERVIRRRRLTIRNADDTRDN
ncbi:kinase-like protein [Peniophora sp. CONT]|nr:kinase-like protein [Peniophora sp. CONT]